MDANTDTRSTNNGSYVQTDINNSIEIQPGFIVSLFSGNDMGMDIETPQPGDQDYIHLNHFLHGKLCAEVKGEQINCCAGDINMGFSDGELFHIQECTDFCNLEIMIRPELLSSLAGEDLTEIDFSKKMEFFIRQGCSCPKLTNAVTRVISLLKKEDKSPLLLHSATLEYLYWHLCALKITQPQECLSTRDKRLLSIAKDILLSDLSSAPTIAELAKTVGINQCKLKKGFKALFGKSIYASFQEERMRRAMDLLKSNNVTETAIALGYSNISHFSTAFRKQYGVLPKEARRELVYELDFSQHKTGIIALCPA